jgi:hypothetical protein
VLVPLFSRKQDGCLPFVQALEQAPSDEATGHTGIEGVIPGKGVAGPAGDKGKEGAIAVTVAKKKTLEEILSYEK